jgi:hypothetical protein
MWVRGRATQKRSLTFCVLGLKTESEDLLHLKFVIKNRNEKLEPGSKVSSEMNLLKSRT